MIVNSTKKARLQLYKRMLKAWQGSDHGTHMGFCWYLLNIVKKDIFFLPELLEQRPKTFYRNRIYGWVTLYWWKPGNREVRIKALERAIEACKPKPMVTGKGDKLRILGLPIK